MSEPRSLDSPTEAMIQAALHKLRRHLAPLLATRGYGEATVTVKIVRGEPSIATVQVSENTRPVDLT